jgi:hypothetical protein
MKNQWKERENSAAVDQAFDHRMLGLPCFDLVRSKAAGCVRARNHTDRTVVWSTIIEMNSNGDHLLEN